MPGRGTGVEIDRNRVYAIRSENPVVLPKSLL